MHVFSGTANQGGMALARMVVLPFVYGIGTPNFQRTVVNLLPWKALHDLRDMVDTIHRNSVEIVNKTMDDMMEGKTSPGQTSGRGNDIMSILSSYITFQVLSYLAAEMSLQSKLTWKRLRKTNCPKVR